MNITFLYALLVWVAVISVITAVITVADKLKAKNGSFRVPEKVLMTLALIGGSFAEYATMRIIRHKTLHKKFMVGLPLIMIAQLAAVLLLFVRFYS